MRSVVKAASLGLAAGQGARELFAPVAPGQVYNQYPTQYVQYDAAPQYAYEQPVSVNGFFPREVRGWVGELVLVTPTLEGSFSAISKPMFASKYTFFSISRDLQENRLLASKFANIKIFAKILGIL